MTYLPVVIGLSRAIKRFILPIFIFILYTIRNMNTENSYSLLGPLFDVEQSVRMLGGWGCLKSLPPSMNRVIGTYELVTETHRQNGQFLAHRVWLPQMGCKKWINSKEI